MRPFQPKLNGKIVIANATTSAAAVELDTSCSEFAFYNTSATATAYIAVTSTEGGETPAAPTAALGFPIPPASGIVRLSFGEGKKSIRAIATAADGNLEAIPGKGN